MIQQTHLHLRKAFALAERALRRGGAPFGALVVQADGPIIAEAINTVSVSSGITRHAEINAIERAQRKLGTKRLTGCAVITSAEPCPMCSGAIFWAGIERVVYGVSIDTIIALMGPDSQLDVGCRALLGASTRPIEVEGPLLEKEGRGVFETWAAQRNR